MPVRFPISGNQKNFLNLASLHFQFIFLCFSSGHMRQKNARSMRSEHYQRFSASWKHTVLFLFPGGEFLEGGTGASGASERPPASAGLPVRT